MFLLVVVRTLAKTASAIVFVLREGVAPRISAASPLTKAVLETDRIALRTRLAALATNVEARTEQSLASLRSDDTQPAQLATLLASLVFLAKWTAQLAELRLGL